jgi:hypothetical protein
MFDTILGMFGGRQDDFAGLDPDDMEMYWRIGHDLDAVQDARKDHRMPVLRKYNLRSVDHGRDVQAAYHARHGAHPDFAAAATRVLLGLQVQEFRANVKSQ